jgi:WD40 repeat protein
MSPNKKFLAVCEKHKNDFSAYITFYDMKNPHYKNVKSHINVCDSTPTNQKQIISISFSNDSKYIACLLDSPDCKAIAWDWYNKNKVIGQFDFAQQQITKITFNPKDNHQVCTSGHNHWKLWRVQENTFKSMQAFVKVE